MGKLRVVREIGGFLRARKKYWLGPILAMIVFVGLLVAVGESSALGPFIYPFF
jgi:uncharacterized membrane protein